MNDQPGSLLERLSRSGRHAEAKVDVCLLVEGCYPYIKGGVSTWIDWLIRAEPHLTFEVVSIWPSGTPPQSLYEPPPNLRALHPLNLATPGPILSHRPLSDEIFEELVQNLVTLLHGGGLKEIARIDSIINSGRGVTLAELTSSPLAWNIVRRAYEMCMPHASFLDFFWAWRALFGGMFAILKTKLPPAEVYHTISTGYAGLLAVKGRLATGKPALITEHGIYTNERRIEILMADWISDTLDKGTSDKTDLIDLRDIWVNVFESYARSCYQACSEVLTLYEDNQILQRQLNAENSKLRIIPNGVDCERFADLGKETTPDAPTVGLIGRVVPIKDIKTFIQAMRHARQLQPNMQALIIGPVDEDPEYYDQCVELVSELELEDCITFTGSVRIDAYLPKIDVLVLTSLSEAQPLVLLEAGAASTACVATDVGSCREILEGRSDEQPNLGPGGLVKPIADPSRIGEAIVSLLRDPVRRSEYGANLQNRTHTYYDATRIAEQYSELYENHLSLNPARVLQGAQ